MDRRQMQEQLVRADREEFEQHPWQLELSQLIAIDGPSTAQVRCVWSFRHYFSGGKQVV
jgi:hypothetical protein